MRRAIKQMEEILKEYEAPNKIRRSPYRNGRYRRGKLAIITSK